MNPDLLLATIQEGLRTVRSFLDYLRTEQGQRQAKIWLDDQQRMRDDFNKFGDWIESLFNKTKKVEEKQ